MKKPLKIRVHMNEASQFLTWVRACLLSYDPKYKEVLTGVTFVVCKKDKNYRIYTLLTMKVKPEQLKVKPYKNVPWDAILEFDQK